MRTYVLRFVLATACALSVSAANAVIADSDVDAHEWNFRVYLDDAEIGYHNFSLVDEGGQKTLSTEAEFKVKFLFITAYRYEHVNEETWQGDCLKAITSRTDANGRKFQVRGTRDADAFEIQVGDGRRAVPGCVKTFAYWNPEILDAPALLNSQTGEMLPVEIEEVATETLNVRGEQMPARRYRLQAKNMELDIWYSADRSRWLALQSTVKGGRKLRYELT